MEYDPQGLVENVGDALGVVSSKVERTVEDFKEFIENRGRETGAWRGEVHGAQKTGGQSGTAGGMRAGGMDYDPEAASPNLGLGSGGGSTQGGSNPGKGMPGTDTGKPTGGKGRSRKRAT
jgi:hypothetical protein